MNENMSSPSLAAAVAPAALSGASPASMAGQSSPPSAVRPANGSISSPTAAGSDSPNISFPLSAAMSLGEAMPDVPVPMFTLDSPAPKSGNSSPSSFGS